MGNLAQNTNFTVGISILGDDIHYAQNIIMPGFNFNSIEVGGRGGARAILGADSVAYDTITVDLLIDEKYTIYKKIINYIIQKTNTEDSTFNSDPFDMWVQVNDNTGNYLMKFEYFGCSLESVDNLTLSTMSEDEEITLSISFRFDQFKLVADEAILTLQI